MDVRANSPSPASGNIDSLTSRPSEEGRVEKVTFQLLKKHDFGLENKKLIAPSSLRQLDRPTWDDRAELDIRPFIAEMLVTMF